MFLLSVCLLHGPHLYAAVAVAELILSILHHKTFFGTFSPFNFGHASTLLTPGLFNSLEEGKPHNARDPQAISFKEKLFRGLGLVPHSLLLSVLSAGLVHVPFGILVRWLFYEASASEDTLSMVWPAIYTYLGCLAGYAALSAAYHRVGDTNGRIASNALPGQSSK